MSPERLADLVRHSPSWRWGDLSSALDPADQWTSPPLTDDLAGKCDARILAADVSQKIVAIVVEGDERAPLEDLLGFLSALKPYVSSAH